MHPPASMSEHIGGMIVLIEAFYLQGIGTLYFGLRSVFGPSKLSNFYG